MFFYDILVRKNASPGFKNSHFSKGVNPCFWSKNCHKDKKFKKSKNSPFFKGVNPSFWSKNGHFSNFFFLGNIGQENVFYDILERKNAFLGYKKKKFKKSKNWHFSKGVNPWFWSQNSRFFNFFFKAI